MIKLKICLAGLIIILISLGSSFYFLQRKKGEEIFLNFDPQYLAVFQDRFPEDERSDFLKGNYGEMSLRPFTAIGDDFGVEVNFLHLALMLKKEKKYFNLINVYRDGIKIKKITDFSKPEDFFLVDNLSPSDGGSDYIIEFIDKQDKPVFISKPSWPEKGEGNFMEIVLTPEYKKTLPKLRLDKDFLLSKEVEPALYDYTLYEGFKRLVYVIKSSPFENDVKIVKIELILKPEGQSLLKIYGEDRDKRQVGPIEVNTFVNPYVLVKYDATFNEHSFLWDDALVSWFSIDLDPFLVKSTLDFYYLVQIKKGPFKGLIPREIRNNNFNLLEKVQENPEIINPISYHPLSSDEITNPFLLGRVELELYKKWGDKERLKRILPNLVDYFYWVEKNRKRTQLAHIGGTKEGEFKQCLFYWTSNFGSGMDNSPRGGGNRNWRNFNQYGWFDMIAQQAALARDIANIAEILEDNRLESDFRELYDNLKRNVRDFYQDKENGFFYDLTPEGIHNYSTETAAFVWGIYAGLVEKDQLQKLIVNFIDNENKFGGYPPLPSLSRDHYDFMVNGEYWLGGAWPPIWWITIIGLYDSEMKDRSSDLSLDVLRAMSEVFRKEGVVYEFYAPVTDENGQVRRGTYESQDMEAKRDFLGWGKLPLILFLQLDKFQRSLNK